MILELNNVQAYYDKSHILNGVTLNVEEGTSTCILGRNGVGKSTTMKTIMGMLNPKAHCRTEGSIKFNGKELVGLDSYKIARLGMAYVPQGRHIFPTLTTEENLRVAERKGVDGSTKWNLETVYDFFPRLKERRNSKGGRLSGGEQQMLAVARGLMQNPKLLLLDEITEGLAPIIVNQLADMVQDLLKEDVTILIAEQNVKFATQVSTDCYILERGAVVHHEATNKLSDDTIHQYLGLS
jgi:branched-chain amino acid transport system ATP-binding protein